MDSEIILHHVERLPHLLEERKQQLDEETYWYVVHNVKIFLKSLYIRLSEEDIHEPLRQSILITLKNYDNLKKNIQFSPFGKVTLVK